jgi:hypothetical protein
MLDRLRAWIRGPAARPIIDQLLHMALSFELPRPQLEAPVHMMQLVVAMAVVVGL